MLTFWFPFDETTVTQYTVMVFSQDYTQPSHRLVLSKTLAFRSLILSLILCTLPSSLQTSPKSLSLAKLRFQILNKGTKEKSMAQRWVKCTTENVSVIASTHTSPVGSHSWSLRAHVLSLLALVTLAGFRHTMYPLKDCYGFIVTVSIKSEHGCTKLQLQL